MTPASNYKVHLISSLNIIIHITKAKKKLLDGAVSLLIG